MLASVVIQKKVITVGRITPSKNIRMLIEVVAELKRQGTLLNFHVIGLPVQEADHAYVKTVHDQVVRLGLENQVFFRGALTPERVRDEYRTAGLFVNASTTGSLDKAGLEAMAPAGRGQLSVAEGAR